MYSLGAIPLTYFTIALLLFLIGLTQLIMSKYFNVSLEGIALRIVRSITSPGYYDHYITAAERQKDDLAYAKWLADTQEAHNRHIEECTRIREAQERTKEELEHNSRSPIYDEYGQELRENGDPVWILK